MTPRGVARALATCLLLAAGWVWLQAEIAHHRHHTRYGGHQL